METNTIPESLKKTDERLLSLAHALAATTLVTHCHGKLASFVPVRKCWNDTSRITFNAASGTTENDLEEFFNYLHNTFQERESFCPVVLELRKIYIPNPDGQKTNSLYEITLTALEPSDHIAVKQHDMNHAIDVLTDIVSRYRHA